MQEIANMETGNYPATLRSLAEEARSYSQSMALNMVQLGRVFTEAKELVPFGGFGEWVRMHAGMSERSAQQLMAIYKRFGERPAFISLDKTKLFKMLALPAGEEDQFMEDNDVENMTSRQVEEAVRRVREQAQAELEKERRAREAAEAKAEELQNRPAEIPQDVQDALDRQERRLKANQEEIDRLKSEGQSRDTELKKTLAEKKAIQQELDEQAQLLEDTQKECDRAQQELLNAQSQIARGDAERLPADALTADIFAGAVRQFIGTVARMPQMRRTFALMQDADRRDYDELLSTVETWAKDARRALETTLAEGVTVR